MRSCFVFFAAIVILAISILGIMLVYPPEDGTSPRITINGTPASQATLEVLGTAQIERTNPLGEISTPITIPTATEIPTPTSIPDPVVYRTEVLIRARHFGNALDAFQETNELLRGNAELLNNPEWRREIQANLDVFVSAAQELSSMQPPPAEYQAINEWLIRIGPEADALRANYRQGLETGEQQYFSAAGGNMQRIIEYMIQAENEMVAAGWES